MTHQNIVDLRELISTNEQLFNSSYLRIVSLRQRVSSINNTHHAVSIQLLQRMEMYHTNAANTLNGLRARLQGLSEIGHTPDSNIGAFALYEQLMNWYNSYKQNVVDHLDQHP